MTDTWVESSIIFTGAKTKLEHLLANMAKAVDAEGKYFQLDMSRRPKRFTVTPANPDHVLWFINSKQAFSRHAMIAKPESNGRWSADISVTQAEEIDVAYFEALAAEAGLDIDIHVFAAAS